MHIPASIRQHTSPYALHIGVIGNQLATLNAPDKNFHKKIYSNLIECIHHRRFEVDFAVNIDKRKQPMLSVLPLDNSMHEEIAKSFPSGDDVDDEERKKESKKERKKERKK